MTLPPLAPPPSLSGRLLLAYSGGLDSTVLLHRLLQQPMRPIQPILAVHVHHGLQASADAWARQCAQQAQAWGVAFECLRVAVPENHASGPEAAAREARYAALASCMQAGDVLVTAHHRDDQAEGLLLAALRGAGPRGLGALRVWQRFPPGWLWRPHLNEGRAALQAYAEAQGLRWVEDPHNSDSRYLRSRLRSEVMTPLAALSHDAAAQLARSAGLCAEQDALLNEYLDAELAGLSRNDSLPLAPLRAMPEPRRRAVLRRWLIAARGLPPPRRTVLQRLDAELLNARPDASPLLAWPGAELRRYRDRLYAFAPLPPLPSPAHWPWTGPGSVQLPVDLGVLHADLPLPSGCCIVLPSGGERFQPRGSAHRRSFKQLFQQRGVPPWLRPRMPMLSCGGQLCWLAGWGAAQGADPAFDQVRWSAPDRPVR